MQNRIKKLIESLIKEISLCDFIKSNLKKHNTYEEIKTEDFEIRIEAGPEFILRWIKNKTKKYTGKQIMQCIINIAKERGYSEIEAWGSKGKMEGEQTDGYYKLMLWGFVPNKDISWVNKLVGKNYSSFEEAYSDETFWDLWKQKGKEWPNGSFYLDDNSISMKQFKKNK
jgi:hypothetical protein